MPVLQSLQRQLTKRLKVLLPTPLQKQSRLEPLPTRAFRPVKGLQNKNFER